MLGSPYLRRVNRVAVSLSRIHCPESQSLITHRPGTSPQLKQLWAAGSWVAHIAWLVQNKKAPNTAVPKQRHPPQCQGSDRSRFPSWLCPSGCGWWDISEQGWQATRDRAPEQISTQFHLLVSKFPQIRHCIEPLEPASRPTIPTDVKCA